MLEKYELYIENAFEPYAAMHESRPHSNLWGKNTIYNDTALQTDHIGYYKPLLMTGEMSNNVQFHEQYPQMVTAWVYDDHYLNEDFNYEDLEKKYCDSQAKAATDPQEHKQQLDQAHK